MDKLENQEELNHSTLQPPLLCIDVYKSRNKVDSSYMVREFVAYKWFDQIIHMYVWWIEPYHFADPIIMYRCL